MKTIKLRPSGFDQTFKSAKEGDVFQLFVHGCKWPAEVRQKSPRVRLLEDAQLAGHTNCELLDEWPDSPEYWPPESAPAPAQSPAANQGRKSA